MSSELNEMENGQLCQSVIESLYEATGGLRNFPGGLKKIIRNKSWERRVAKGRLIELSSLRELITEKPFRGWGEDPKTIESVIKDDPEALVMFREAMKGKEGGDKRSQNAITGNNVTSDDAKRETGNSRAYSLDRVQRECEPEVVAKVMSGDKSANAALVEAGIRENRQFYVPRDPAKAAQKFIKFIDTFGREFCVAFGDAFSNHLKAMSRDE